VGISTIGEKKKGRKIYVGSAWSGFQSLAGGFWTLPLRMHRVQTQILCVVPSTTARTLCRFGAQDRAVTLWAWLICRPMIVFLLQIAHCLAMMIDSLAPIDKSREAYQSRSGFGQFLNALEHSVLGMDPAWRSGRPGGWLNVTADTFATCYGCR